MVLARTVRRQRVGRRCGDVGSLGAYRRFGAIVAVASMSAACGGDDSARPADVTQPEVGPQTTSAAAGSTISATDTTASTTTITTTATIASAASTVPEVIDAPGDWTEQLIAAFDTYDRTRNELNDETSRRLSGTQELTEQEIFDVYAEQYAEWADAGDLLTASLPPVVPPDVAPAFEAMLDTHVALVAQLRAASDGLLEGDPEPANELRPFRDAFNTTCAELQFVLRDLGAGQLACGIDGEDPDVRSFVEGATVDSTEQLVALPAGEYELDYVGIAPTNPDLVVGLTYDEDRLIRSSVEVLEIADAEDGPSIRLFANELVADPTDLAPDRIRNFWFNTEGPEGWIGALADVVVAETGEGEISGVPAEYWVLVSELDAPIAILGDGDDWVPETTLDPGEPVRLWSVILDDHPLILTEHVPAGATLDEFTDELSALRAGLTLAIG